MFDFRYHALSLAAVFLALAVGLLLGVAIGDSGLVSSAKQDIEESLRGDVREARAEAGDLRGDLRAQEDFTEAAYPLLVNGELTARRLGLLFIGGASNSTAGLVRDALRDTGASLAWVGGLREPLDRGALAERADDTRYVALADDDELVEPFGFRMGAQLVLGGKLVQSVRPALMRSFSGRLEPLDGLIVVRGDAPKADQRDALTFEKALAEGIAATGLPAVGIEVTSTEPSNTRWYRDRSLSSVDSVDRIAGRAALVFALAGAEGAFGTKSSAQALLPDLTGG